jgi:hypothetical protein
MLLHKPSTSNSKELTNWLKYQPYQPLTSTTHIPDRPIRVAQISDHTVTITILNEYYTIPRSSFMMMLAIKNTSHVLFVNWLLGGCDPTIAEQYNNYPFHRSIQYKTNNPELVVLLEGTTLQTSTHTYEASNIINLLQWIIIC